MNCEAIRGLRKWSGRQPSRFGSNNLRVERLLRRLRIFRQHLAGGWRPVDYLLTTNLTFYNRRKKRRSADTSTIWKPRFLILLTLVNIPVICYRGGLYAC